MKKTLFQAFCLLAFQVSAQTTPTSTPVLTVTAITTGLAATPLAAGSSGNKVLGFSAHNSSAANDTITRITIYGIGSAHVTAATISSFSGSGSSPVETVYFSGSQVVIGTDFITFMVSPTAQATGIPIAHSTSKELYLVITVNAAVTAATSTAAPVLYDGGGIFVKSGGRITFSQGHVISSRTYSFRLNNTSVAVANAGLTGGITLNDYNPTLTGAARPALFGLTFTDLGGDAIPTEITSLTFYVENFSEINTLGLYATSGSGVQEVTTELTATMTTTTTPAGARLTFNGSPANPIILSIANGFSKTISLRAAFKDRVTDNKYINMSLTEATVSTGSSPLAVLSGANGLLFTTTSNVTNKINVVATHQKFSPASYTVTPPEITVPPTAFFSLTIAAVDEYGNTDLDWVGSSTFSNPTRVRDGVLTSYLIAPTPPSFVNGSASWSHLQLEQAGLGNHTVTFSSTRTVGTSSASLVNANLTVVVPGVRITHTPSSMPVVCSQGDSQPLGSIEIEEVAPGDFSPSVSATLLLALPFGFEFDPAITSRLSSGVTSAYTSDITYPTHCYSYTNNKTVVSIRFSVNGIAAIDKLTISNLKVRYIGVTTPSTVVTGCLTRIGGTAVIRGNEVMYSRKHATLTAADATNATYFGTRAADPPTFTVSGDGISATQTVFDVGIQEVSIVSSPAIVSPNAFSGNVTQTTTDPINVTFSPTRAGLGDHRITYRIQETKTGQRCFTRASKTFSVAQDFIGLVDKYCTNSTRRDDIRLPHAKTIQGLYYELDNVQYYKNADGTGAGIPITVDPLILPITPATRRTFRFPPPNTTLPTATETWTLKAFYKDTVKNSTRPNEPTSRQVTFNLPPPSASFKGERDSRNVFFMANPTTIDPTRDNFFCTNSSPITLIGSPTTQAGVGEGRFTVTDAAGNTLNGSSISGNTFAPRNVLVANQGVGDDKRIRLAYTYTNSSTGCSTTSDFVRIKVVLPPVPLFRFSSTSRYITSTDTYCKSLNSAGAEQDATLDFVNETSSVGTGNLATAWDFGEPSSGTRNTASNLDTPSHNYSAAGNHNVRLRVTGPGCSADSIRTVKIGITPNPLITGFSTTEFCATDLSYDNGGNTIGKIITLSTTGGTNEYKIGNSNWVNMGYNPATPATTTPPAAATAVTAVNTFKLIRVPAASGSIDFNFANYINQPTQISYRNTSTETGCFNRKDITVAAYSPPTVDFTTNGTSRTVRDGTTHTILCRTHNAQEVLQPVTAQFTNTTTGYDGTADAVATHTTWLWNFGVSVADNQTTQHASYSYTMAAREDYNVSLTATGRGGCVVTKTSPLRIGDTPNPKFVGLANNAEFCIDELRTDATSSPVLLGKQVQLSISSGSNEYRIGNGNYVSIDAQTSFYLTTANYTVFNQSIGLFYQNTDDNSGCSAATSILITAYRPPTVDFTTAHTSSHTTVDGTHNVLCRTHNAQEVLQPVAAQFTNTTTGYDNTPATVAPHTTWLWNFGVSVADNQTTQHASYSYTMAAREGYNISLTATGRGGCIRTKTTNLRIGDTPNPKFVGLANNAEFCADELRTNATSSPVLRGKQVQLSIASGTNAYRIGNGNYVSIGAQTSFHLTTANYTKTNSVDSLTYRNTDEASGCSAATTIYITAFRPPIANFTTNAIDKGVNNPVLCRLLSPQEVLQPVTATFTNTTTRYDAAPFTGSLPNEWVWKWNFGSPSAPNGTNESAAVNGAFDYENEGIYTISLEVKGKGDCSHRTTKQIIVGDTPNPKFQTTADEFCSDDLAATVAGGGVILRLNLSKGENSFSVDNGGYTSIATASFITLMDTPPPVSRVNAYDYRSRIGLPTVIKYKNVEGFGKCENEVSKTIVVYKPPTIAFSQGYTLKNNLQKEVLCLPLNTRGENIPIDNRFDDQSTVASANNSGIIKSWHWNFGDNSPTTPNNDLPSPTHTYSTYNANGRVTLTIVGSGECRRTLTKDLLIGRTPNPKFISHDFYASGGASYCESELVAGIPVNLSLAEGKNEYSIHRSPYKSISRDNRFTLYASAPTTGLGDNYLFINSHLDSVLSIAYKNTENITECTNTTTGSFIVHKLPWVSFNARENDALTDYHCLLSTTDGGTDFRLNLPPNQPSYLEGLNENVKWDFGDGTGSTAAKSASVNHKYSSAGEYRVRLDITDRFACQNSRTITFPVAYQPIAGFYAAKFCAGEGTEFKFTTALPRETEKTRATYQFNFGDGHTLTHSLDAATWQGTSISHPYAALGKYSVNLTVNNSLTSGGRQYTCQNSALTTVGIVPQITEKNYSEHFETQGGHWITQGWVNDNRQGTDWNFEAQNSWPTASNEHGLFWSTRNNEKYEPLQRSSLYSPCFDLRAKGYYPILSFDYFSQLPDQKDGAYLEYSYDGKTWSRLTNDNSGFGRNWYNKNSISGLTKRSLPDAFYGQEIDQRGWTNESNGWVNAKYDLSGTAYKRKIRFRFLFGSNDERKEIGPNGFAVDNFSLYPRNTTVLGEHFFDKDNAADTDRFFSFRNQDTLFVKLAYFSALSNAGDPDYLANTADPDARVTYYGVSAHPWSFINGANRYEGGNRDIASWGTQVFNDKILDNSPIEITDIKTELADRSNLVITPTLRALTQIPKGTWVVQAAIVENVNDRQIIRKFLPNTSGVPLTARQGADQVFSQTYRWGTGSRIQNAARAGVVVFVQNLDTKNVMQVAYKSIGGISLPVTTGFENYSKDATLYPNPAKDGFYLELPFANINVLRLTLTNMAGQVIDLPYTPTGHSVIRANISTLTDGIYIVQAHSKNGIIQKKLAISR